MTELTYIAKTDVEPEVQVAELMKVQLHSANSPFISYASGVNQWDVLASNIQVTNDQEADTAAAFLKQAKEYLKAMEDYRKYLTFVPRKFTEGTNNAFKPLSEKMRAVIRRFEKPVHAYALEKEEKAAEAVEKANEAKAGGESDVLDVVDGDSSLEMVSPANKVAGYTLKSDIEIEVIDPITFLKAVIDSRKKRVPLEKDEKWLVQVDFNLLKKVIREDLKGKGKAKDWLKWGVKVEEVKKGASR